MNTEIPTTLKFPIGRLNYELPEFPVRTVWTSSEAQLKWHSRISRIAKVWEVIERHRENSLQNCKEEDLPHLIEECKKIGRLVVPLVKVGISAGYGNSKEFVEGQPFTYRVAITTEKDVDRWIKIANHGFAGDWNRDIGQLLGYPPCCIAFFQNIWITEKFLDTTWPMASNSLCGYLPTTKVRTLDITLENTLNNILLRWLGVRAVSHLPCSFNCASTLKIAKTNLAKMGELFGEEAEHLKELLDMPVVWSALHGICEVRTPICKFIARTDATGEEYKVNVKVVRNEVKLLDTWTDNGFSSLSKMEEAHKPIISAFKTFAEPGKVLDLGCGNGELLNKLQEHNIPCGVDISAAKIKKCKEKMPNGIFTAGSMFIQPSLWERDYSCIIFTPRRLLETNEELAHYLLGKIRKHTKLLITYYYDDYAGKRYSFEGRDGWKLRFDYGSVKVYYHD